MTKRQELEALIGQKASQDLQDELEYLEEVYDFDPPEYDRADLFLMVAEDSDEGRNFLKNECRAILIEAGFYRPISDEELSQTVQTGGGKKYDFQKNRIKYVSDYAYSTFLEPRVTTL